MSPDPEQDRAGRSSPGTERGAFVLVVGPSGAGKDTLIAGARTVLQDIDGVAFVRRVITRPPDRWEAHDGLSAAEFEDRRGKGGFALSWDAHGLSYGVPAESIGLVRSGRIVVCNGSRGAIGEAMRVFGRTCVIYVTAPREVRLARLAARGRESDIGGRLDRQPMLDAEQISDLVIDNSGPPSHGISVLTDYLRSLCRVA